MANGKGRYLVGRSFSGSSECLRGQMAFHALNGDAVDVAVAQNWSPPMGCDANFGYVHGVTTWRAYLNAIDFNCRRKEANCGLFDVPHQVEVEGQFVQGALCEPSLKSR